MGLAIGISLLSSTLLPFIKQVSKGRGIAKESKRKTEGFTDEEIVRRLCGMLEGVPPCYLEGRVICQIGVMTSYFKKRGEATGKLTERGQYLIYEVMNYLEKYPKLRKESYTLDLLSKIDPPLYLIYSSIFLSYTKIFVEQISTLLQSKP